MSRTRRRIGAIALTLCAGVWACVVLAAPYLATHFQDRPMLLTTAAVYVAGGMVCHQRPARSFYAWGAQLPVCARCTGLYLAAPLGAAVALKKRSRTSARRPWPTLIIAGAPSVAIWLLELSGAALPGNWIRFVAATPLGAVTAWLLTGALGDTEVN